MDIIRINPNIRSENMEKSSAFFTDLIGIKLVMNMQWIITFASVSNSTAQLSILTKDTSGNFDKDITLTIEVADIDAVYEKAILIGYKIVYPLTDEVWGVRRFGV